MAIDKPIARILQGELRHNCETRNNWEYYASHRTVLMGLLEQAARTIAAQDGCPSLAIFGAGNCNDIDLTRLAHTFEIVRLLDVDGEALSLARQQSKGRVETFVDDLVGWPEPVAEGDNGSVAFRQLQATLDRALRAVHVPACDVTLSANILTQLFRQLISLISETSTYFLDLLLLLREVHLSQLLSHTRSGGIVIVSVDFVSTDTLPQLSKARPIEVPALVERALASGNFFHGTNPVAMLSRARKLPHVRRVSVTDPWIWRLSATRAYLVYALVMVRD